MTTFKPPLVIFLLVLFFSSSLAALELFGVGGPDPDYIWKSGLNRYLKYVEQEKTVYGNNDHPVELNSNDIKNALLALEIADDSFFAEPDSIKRVLTFRQIKLLSEELPKAFRNARANQDIVFVLEKNERKALGLRERRYMAGRLFYKDGKLNIILGEYDFFRSKAFESVYDPSGQNAVPYNFNLGSRERSSKVLNRQPLIKAVGIENKILKKVRYDWFLIDVSLAARAYVDKGKGGGVETAQTKQLERETAKLAKQRREMRAEMARIRKEMKSAGGGSSVQSIEDRIATLEQLKNKNLITEKEYTRKRQEILNDI